MAAFGLRQFFYALGRETDLNFGNQTSKTNGRKPPGKINAGNLKGIERVSHASSLAVSIRSASSAHRRAGVAANHCLPISPVARRANLAGARGREAAARCFAGRLAIHL